MLAETQTYNASDAVTTRIWGLSVAGFTMKLQESEFQLEDHGGTHADENVGYLMLAGALSGTRRHNLRGKASAKVPLIRRCT